MLRASTLAIVLLALAAPLPAKDAPPPVKSAPPQKMQALQPADTLPPLPAGQSWKLTWHDEFDGTKLDESKWGYRPDGPRKEGWWDRKVVTLTGQGHLSIAAIKEGDKYLSGCIVTTNKFEHAFGYWACRVQFQKQPGHWSAFWLTCKGVQTVGDDGRDGTEIDIFEKPKRDDSIGHNLHWDGYGKDHKHVGKNDVKVPNLMEGWHTIGMWWTPQEYIFYVDGKETWRYKGPGVSQVPEYILLSNEIGKWAGKITDAKLPDDFKVDYVRVYDITEKPAVNQKP